MVHLHLIAAGSSDVLGSPVTEIIVVFGLVGLDTVSDKYMDNDKRNYIIASSRSIGVWEHVSLGGRASFAQILRAKEKRYTYRVNYHTCANVHVSNSKTYSVLQKYI